MSVSRSKQWEKLAHDFGITALVAYRRGDVVAEWGAVHEPYNIRSIRKNLLNALYGTIPEISTRLGATLAELDIDDREELTASEREATVRHLLMARSGVYHPAAYEQPRMKDRRPRRGSKRVGEHWYYNNWDFNALGVIYEKISSEDIFESFEHRIARRIGLQDFAVSRCHRIFEPVSWHPAQIFSLSARDLARFGLLFLNDGRWGGEQVIPSSWIEESTTNYSKTDLGRLGFGYLWWICPSDGIFGPGGYLALGAGGQGLAVLPSHDLVVAQLVNVEEGAETLGAVHFVKMLRSIIMH